MRVGLDCNNHVNQTTSQSNDEEEGEAAEEKAAAVPTTTTKSKHKNHRFYFLFCFNLNLKSNRLFLSRRVSLVVACWLTCKLSCDCFVRFNATMKKKVLGIITAWSSVADY